MFSLLGRSGLLPSAILQKDLQRRAVGAYLGVAVGDALGATTEFLTPREIEHKYGIHDKIIGGGWLHLKPGHVTDDTEMSLALGRSILENDGVVAAAAAEAFSDWMRTKPVDIGNTVRRGIVHYRNTGEPFTPENEFDAGNGACMRSVPVALAYWNAPVEELIAVSRAQSHVTHNNSQADAGTEAILKMTVAALTGTAKADLKATAEALVAEHKPYRYDRKKAQNPSAWIVHTLKVVFQSFFGNDSFEATLVDAVNRGGDADTTGAIVGMLAGAYYGADAIPKSWLKALKPDVRKACEKQALDLLKLAERRVSNEQ
jgi:ADP-ribosyl-[dinitrogen reductase] hydrolase